MLVANLAPKLERRAPAEHAQEVLERFADGITTAEVAAIRTGEAHAPMRDEAEAELLELVADGRARREPIGDDALWHPAG